MKLAEARSTATSHCTCGAPGAAEADTTVHTTAQGAGQLKVNHRWLLFGATAPVNCVPTRISLLLPSSADTKAAEDSVPSLDRDVGRREVGNSDPVSDVFGARPFDPCAPPDLRGAGPWCGGNNEPEHLPDRGPVVGEPCATGSGGDGSTELDADPWSELTIHERVHRLANDPLTDGAEVEAEI